MDNELLKEAAKSCGFDLHWHSDGKLDITQKQLEQLAVFLAAAEREACAKICIAESHQQWAAFEAEKNDYLEGRADGADYLALKMCSNK